MATFPATASAQMTATRPLVPGAPAGVTAFVDVHVVPMDTERVLSGHTVLIEQGKIIALGPSAEVTVPATATRIDGRGKYLIPGLADMHAHLVQTSMFAGGRSDSAALEQRLFEWLSSGVTTVRNMDWTVSPEEGERTLRFKARAAAGTLWSPRIYTAGPFLPMSDKKEVPPEAMGSYVAAYKAQGYDFIKIHHGASAEQFDSIVAAARRLGMPLLGHVPLDVLSTGSELERAFAAGYRSIEHLGGYHQHVYRKHVRPELPEPARLRGGKTPPTEEQRARTRRSYDPIVDSAFMAAVRQQLDAAQPTLVTIAAATKQAGVWNTPTLALYVRHPFAAHIVDAAAFSQRVVAALQEAGAGLLLGTDVMGNLRITVQDELQALVAAGLTPYQALVTGTRNAAQYFGTLDESGTIAVGKRADLVLLTGNPLVEIRHTQQPAGVMLGGRWLAREEINRRLAAIAVGSQGE